MKRFISIALILTMLFALAACRATVAPAEEPTAEPTEAPSEAPTEEPSEEPSEEPTEEPVVGIENYCVRLENGVAASVDLNFDGENETVLFSEEPKPYDEYESMLSVSFTNQPAYVFDYKVEYSYGVSAWIMDCDPTDSKLDIVISYCQDSDDWSSAAFRINDEGTRMDTFEDYFGIILPEDYSFDSEAGFPIFTRTDILGTTDVNAYYTVTAEGFKLVSDEYTYPVYEDGFRDLELVRELELELVDEDGKLTGEKITVPAGEVITPYSTDLETYVCVKLADGRIGRASVELKTGDEWGIYLNGINQNEYAEIPYAD